MARPKDSPNKGRNPERDPRPTGVVPGRPYQYKRAPTALYLDDETLKKLMGCAQRQMSKNQAAGFLGVKRDTFLAFLDHYPEAEEVWAIGRQRGRAVLKNRYYDMALVDPGMMRHAAKHYLGMDDKETVDVTATAEVRVASVDEARKRAAELMAKLGLTIDSSSGAIRTMKDVTPRPPFQGTRKA